MPCQIIIIWLISRILSKNQSIFSISIRYFFYNIEIFNFYDILMSISSKKINGALNIAYVSKVKGKQV